MGKPIILITLAYILRAFLSDTDFSSSPISIGIFIVLGILIAGILASFGISSLSLFLFAGIIGMVAYIYSAASFPAHHSIRVRHHFFIMTCWHG